MADLTIDTIQPNNLIKRLSGEVLSPIASSDFKEVGKQKVTQKIEQKTVELTDLKSQEVNGQIYTAELDTCYVRSQYSVATTSKLFGV